MFTDKPSAEDYRTSLNASLNVGVEYNFLRNHFAIGLMSHTEFIGKQIYSEPYSLAQYSCNKLDLGNREPHLLGK